MTDNNAGTYSENFGEDFQARILAVAIRDTGFAIGHRSVLDAAFFTSAAHRAVAKAFLKHLDKHRVEPSAELMRALIREEVDAKLVSAVSKIVDDIFALDLSDKAAVIEKAIQFGQTQAVVNAVIEAGDIIDEGKDKAKILTLVQRALQVGTDLNSIGSNYVTDFEDRVHCYTGGTLARDVIPTGIPHIDAAMDGGLGRGELGVILAPPKKGKTTTLINIGHGAMTHPKGYSVVHYTLEMDADIVQTRYDDRLMLDEVNIKRTDPEKYVELLRNRVSTLVRGAHITQRYIAHKTSVRTLRSHLDILKAQGFCPDLIVVDYARLLLPADLPDLRLQLDGVYLELRAIAQEYNAAVWTGAQSTTGSFDKETITMADFAESRGIAAIVDAAWAFCQTNNELIESKARLFGVALRYTESGVTVEIEANRKQCLLRSTGLFDPSYSPVPTKADEAPQGKAAQAETTPDGAVKPKPKPSAPKPPPKPSAVSAAPSKATAILRDSLKQAGGTVGPKPKPKFQEKQRQLGVPPKPDSARKPKERPSKKVG